jgi:hypothetical protein
MVGAQGIYNSEIILYVTIRWTHITIYDITYHILWLKPIEWRLGMVVHAYNPIYLGGGDQEDHSSRPA